MSSTITRVTSRPIRLTCFILAIVALLIIVTPGMAAGTQGLSRQDGSTRVAAVILGDSNAQSQPEATCATGGQCFADVPSSNPFYAFANRIYQQDLVTGYPCGGAGEPCDASNRPYYRPGDSVTRQQMAKFIDNARHLPQISIIADSSQALLDIRNATGKGVYGESSGAAGVGVYGYSANFEGVHGESPSNYAGVYGKNTNASFQAPGVRGDAVAGPGVYGISTNFNGVSGQTQSNAAAGVYGNAPNGGFGVQGESSTGNGVVGTSAGTGVYGISTGTAGSGVKGEGDTGVLGIGAGAVGIGVFGQGELLAGEFVGDISVSGNCIGCLGASKIDHPLDPENKYLYHSAVESSDMMDVYNGNITLDARGEAMVQLPDWFGALNKEYRYQLTAIGAPGPNLYISRKIENNRFSIAGGAPGSEVSWQVTGIRQDPYSNAHPNPVEEEKSEAERGKYLHPTELGQPESKGLNSSEGSKR